MKLTEVKDANSIRYVDSRDRIQGVNKVYHRNGNLKIHCMYKDDDYHGEYKDFKDDGTLKQHYFFCGGTGDDITDEVRALVEDFNNITDEERMMIKLKFGIECLC